MATLYTHQDQNVRKTWFLMTMFFVVVIAIAWAFSYILDNPAILYFGVIFSIVMNIWSYWYSDSLVIKMSGAKKASREQYFDLWNAVENLSITAGLPMPALYVIDDPSPNAFATGRDKEHSAVAVTTGLLQILNKNELEGVIAHELSHIGNRDILLGTVVVVLVGFIAIASDMFLRMSIYGRGGNRDGRIGLILMIVGIVLAILAPIVAQLIKLAISRKREFLADASGALLTRYPEGLASALEKISGYPVGIQRVSTATAHLYISNPLKDGKAVSFMSKLFATHPPAEERISALRGM
ncbi:MAG: zinc metalloprotease HtpX [Candidatus Yonathbacteria bacterium CG10_big_fil_rev_8_21_14_0_10_43_136]|uniref:Protease HtpX homolog n=2 Tax=Parcubacteria group TaxID=1794811 RepID=A0A2M7Q548_9BACT|nr:MAG: zinc metalloprotease HtpX [Candidatus Nomurabacteria bacterium CG2_30_43_9]PIR40728.1 MAG: zinc metalloprotease HtpX [Candidatus Yonathbacteria bacterium CG10_big_fil_rev_8_21_14_0_10_43_136]PIX57313.1 MAG: zinc metalloprotease HtpX [Candidatus Yonathbacteria bacterium CG_4_10_14_3_um_filter_43_12]PIY58567.1 MAG: zinc metalloprotease HtpX [Candidatus Yonathbacteria bacterium CG_4_10_14_0_8_um_filter_43_17]PJC22562.1 MAG: zinc metalloprotease HtpX [Candidatus Yonathbacteria bacterium CG_